jgi:hypothetical protein
MADRRNGASPALPRRPAFSEELRRGRTAAPGRLRGVKQREEKIPPEGKIRLTEALERLVKLYDTWDQKDKADEWRKKLPVAKSAKPAETKKD